MNVTYSMKVCAEQVRCTPCNHCLHYVECMRSGKPASLLGQHLAHITANVIPQVIKELGPLFKDGLKLKAYAPTLSEVMNGHYSVIRCYNVDPLKVICHVYLNGNESTEEIKTKLFNECVRKLRKRHHGK